MIWYGMYICLYIYVNVRVCTCICVLYIDSVCTLDIVCAYSVFHAHLELICEFLLFSYCIGSSSSLSCSSLLLALMFVVSPLCDVVLDFLDAAALGLCGRVSECILTE